MRPRKALSHIERAEQAWDKGRCLKAGTEIDRAYMALGKKSDKRLLQRLKRLDGKFERACVRKHPRGGR